MDHISYRDVMNFAATCRSFLHEVLPLMRRLFLEHAEELHMSQARRFRNGNIQEIRIYSYRKYRRRREDEDIEDEEEPADEEDDSTEDDEDVRHYRRSLCESTAYRAVPFLCAFPKLKSVFIGGVVPERNIVLEPLQEKEEKRSPETAFHEMTDLICTPASLGLSDDTYDRNLRDYSVKIGEKDVSILVLQDLD